MLLQLHGLCVLNLIPSRHLLPSRFSPSSSLSHLTSHADPSSLLQQCTTPHQIKQLHAHVLTTHPHPSPFLSSLIVTAYTRLGLLPDAQSTFTTSPSHLSPLLWNSILRATLSHNLPRQTLSLYQQMRSLGAIPDSFTLPLVIRACSALGHARLSTTIHNHVITIGYQTHLHVGNELVLMYGKLGCMDLAVNVFDEMPVRNIVSWNTLISGFTLNFELKGAYDAFRIMESMGVEPNNVTWTSLLSAHGRCGKYSRVIALFEEMRACGCRGTAEAVSVVLSAFPYTDDARLCRGKKIHGYVVRSGFEGYPFVVNSLVCMYGKMGKIEDAERVFSQSKIKDLVSWNALISSYAAAGLFYEAYRVFARMEATGDLAPNVVSWSAVIGGFASVGMMEQSLGVFRLMQLAGIRPNSVTVAIILSACAELSALRLGREIHGHVIRGLMEQNLLAGNGLVNMYTKSGSLHVGRLVFDMIEEKDLITWNSMIAGYAMHGLCDGALIRFSDMVRAGFEPDGISFLAVLSACSHVGRIAEGRQLFDQMIHKYKLSPSVEHYSCMVDLLGRAGLLHVASSLMARMPMEPNVCVWGALLNSCRIHGNIAIAEDTLRRIDELEGESSGSYILLSNIYAASGRWGDSAGIRVLTKERGLKKNPGQSWIEVKEKVHVFSAGSSLPSGAEEAYGVLEDLNHHMESDKYMSEDWLMLDKVGEEGNG